MEVGQYSSEKEAKKKQRRWVEIAVRFLAFANTLAAAIVLGTDKQTKVVAMQLIPTLPPIDVPVTAKWKYMSAFVYFVVLNGIACTYAAISLILTTTSFGGRTSVLIAVADLMMVALIFSGCGAAFAVGLLGFKGNSHVRWNKVCNVFGRFCSQVGGAITVSLAGGAFFLLLVIIAIFKLHNNNKHR